MRRQRPRGATTRDSVVDAALAVVDRSGVGALTIRAVAEQVGAPPMSLYTHFANKEELIDLMYAEIARRMYADAQHPIWQSELLALCTQVRSLLLAHPLWAPLLSRPAPPMTVPLRERLLSLMAKDGMSAEVALQALSSAVLMSIGLVLVELAFRGKDGQSELTKRFEGVRSRVDNDDDGGTQNPVTRSAFAKLRRFDLDANFLFAVRTFIAGLEAKRRTSHERGPN